MITQSQNDKRQYKSIKLVNDLECVLISDPETQKSAAAMVVNVGSLEDPLERQGLAHFCEHMLFLGSEKYPNEGEYRDFINSNSGGCNAYTSSLITNYMFQISNNAFEGALDRFAQFFIAPLFTQSGTEREMKAVDSEFNMNFKVDAWRKSMVMKQLHKPDHKSHQFSIGNMKTLLYDDTREFLLKFHKRWYSSNLMKLVVLGSQSLDQLEKWVTDTFSQIENKNLEAPKYDDDHYQKYGKLVKYVPIKDYDQIEIRWIVQYLHPFYKNSPANYVSHLLGHEGENSLFSLLKAEGLALELTSGSSTEMRSCSYQFCRVKLTKKGLKEVKRVIGFIYQYLHILKERGVQKWIFDETKLIKQLQFDYLEKISPFDYVSTLAYRLVDYPIEDILKVYYFNEEFKVELLTDYINSLQTEKVFIVLTSQEFKGELDVVEEYFGSEYSIIDIPQDYREAMTQPQTIKKEQCDQPLDLPPHNIFLPKSTDILPIQENDPVMEPIIILETDKSTLWYKRDNIFKVPKAFVYVRIYTIDLNYGISHKTEILAKIWRKLIDYHLRELMYMADEAIVYPAISLSPNGVTLTFEGFNDALSLLIEKYLQKILTFKIQDYQQYFDDSYLSVKLSLENALKEKPYVQIQNTKTSLFREGSHFTYASLLKALEGVTFSDLIQFQNNWLKKMRFETLVQGNIDRQTAILFQRRIEEVFECSTLSKDHVLQMRPIKLSKDEIYNYNFTLTEPGETNSAVLIHYDLGPLDNRGLVLVDVMLNVIKTDFFEQLRTQEQLGYAVFSFLFDSRGVHGFQFLIQSNARSCHFVQNRIRDFIQNKMKDSIRELTQDKFESSKESIRVSLLEKDYKLSQEVMRNWTQIQKHKYDFDIKQLKLNFLDDIKLEELQELYLQTFLEDSKCLEIHAKSEIHKEEDENLCKERTDKVSYSQSIYQLKRRLQLYQDFYGI